MLAWVASTISRIFFKAYTWVYWWHPTSTMQFWNYSYNKVYQYVSKSNLIIPYTNFGFWFDPGSENRDLNLIGMSIQSQLDNKSSKYCEKQQCGLQLYAVLLTQGESHYLSLNGKKVIEVGCGGGGGCLTLFMLYKPQCYRGVDLSETGVQQCNALKNELPSAFPSDADIKFLIGNSMKLSAVDDPLFAGEQADVVFNCESSHCYADCRSFIMEVSKLLRNNGYFLWCDLQYKNGITNMLHWLEEFDLEVLKCRNITKNVSLALDLDPNTLYHEMLNQTIETENWYNKLFAHCCWNVGGMLSIEALKKGSMEYFMIIAKKVQQKRVI